MSRRSLPISMVSARLVRARPKYSSVVRVSDLSKHLLFAEELAGRPRVFGDEHGRGRPCVADQPVHHFTDLLPADFREADTAFDALGGKRHQALLDDIAGVLEIGRECE